MRALQATPLLIILMGVSAALMLVPSFYAWVIDDHHVMRSFFYSAILFGLLSLVLGLATQAPNETSTAQQQLLTLVLAFFVLPLVFALPLGISVPSLGFFDAWFEMVSSFTTTGATIFDAPLSLSPALHLWRALIAWFGGFLIWVSAIAIFAPLNLGGFEVRAFTQAQAGQLLHVESNFVDIRDVFGRYTARLLPIYVGLTFVLWFALTLAGERSFIALCHAMSVMSSSGITPLEHFSDAQSGWAGEFVVIIFFVFLVSHLSFGSRVTGEQNKGIIDDPEGRTAVALILSATLFIIMKHFFAPTASAVPFTFDATFEILWGAVFTVTSFLTTTGFESQYWDLTLAWSGMKTPQLLLMCLATIGGGVATTAGGVKLLRIYALSKHGEREIEKLVHPSSVGGGGRKARRIRRKGAYISWLFFMLFAMSVAVVMVALSLLGQNFEHAVMLAVSSLSTTGPLLTVAGGSEQLYQDLPSAAKLVLALAMILGRLETLAMIALFNPEIWRK